MYQKKYSTNNKKSVYEVLCSILVIILMIGIFLLIQYKRSLEKENSILTESQVVTLVKKSYPEYIDYPSNNLPRKRLEIVSIQEGWHVGMYIEGSGVPGILKANCFLVNRHGDVLETGLFQGEGPAKSINLSTCTPKE